MLLRPAILLYSSAAMNMPRGGAVKYSHNVDHPPGGTAEPKVLAGFIDVPESGCSKVIKATRIRATNTPVQRATRCLFETVNTTIIKMNEMKNSAAKATAKP